MLWYCNDGEIHTGGTATTWRRRHDSHGESSSLRRQSRRQNCSKFCLVDKHRRERLAIDRNCGGRREVDAEHPDAERPDACKGRSRADKLKLRNVRRLQAAGLEVQAIRILKT